MAILEALLDALPQAPEPIRGVVTGVHWTAVTSRFCGLAASLRDENEPRRRVRGVGQLHQKSAQELAGWVLSENPLEASIGMAALNSLIEVDETQAREVNALDVLIQHGRGKNIAVIGHFPFTEQLRQAAGQLWVIEQQPRPGDYPAEAAADLLPQAHVIAITGSALTNHTLEDLLPACAPGSIRMVLGPSTPLSRVLFGFGFHYIAGSRVVNENQALLTIQQGAVFQQVQGVRRLVLSAENFFPN